MMVSFNVNFMKKLSKYSIALFILCCGSAIAQTTSNTNNILKDAENKLVAKVDGESIFLDEILEMAKQLPREYQKLSLAHWRFYPTGGSGSEIDIRYNNKKKRVGKIRTTVY